MNKSIENYDSDHVKAPPLVHNENGELLCPGHPKMCLHSGDFKLFECACDECDSFLVCYPEHQAEVDEALEDLRDLKAAERAIEKHRKNSVTYTHDEVKKMLDQDGE